MTQQLTGPSATEALEPLRISAVTLLTTYRKDGQGVGTPVGINVQAEKAFFTTRSKTWKVKRMNRNQHVTVAPCTKTGKVLGDTVPAVVRRVSEEELRAHQSNFQYKLWRVVYRIIYRDLPVTYEITPVA